MPWELLHDGHEFLGVRCVISRTLPELLPPDEPMLPPESMVALIIANPTGELEEADREAKELYQFLKGKGVTVHVLRGPQANSWEFLGRLKSGQYNIIHYTGHAGYAEEEEEGFLELADGNFPASMIVTNLAGSPLVFVNGCGSAHQPRKRSRAFKYDANVSSLPEAFLSRGARGFIGTSWLISDQSARIFSRFFYEALLTDKRTLGEAMAYARACSREVMKDDVAWAAFVSYGHPQNRLVVPEGTPVVQPPPVEPVVGPVVDEKKGINTRRLGEDALLALFYAWDERRRLGHTYLETAHLVIGLTKVSGGHTQRALYRQGKNPNRVRDELRRHFGDEQNTDEEMGRAAELTMTRRLRQILRLAETAAEEEGSSQIEEKHLLIGFVREGGGETARILRKSLGIDLDKLMREVIHPLFPDGQLDEALLDPSAREIIHTAEKLAAGLGSKRMSTFLFFQALLEREQSLVSAGLRAQQRSPERVSRGFRRIYQLGQSTSEQSKETLV